MADRSKNAPVERRPGGYLKWCGVAFVIFFLSFFLVERPFDGQGISYVVGALSNSFTLPGVLLFGVGTLSFVYHRGAYDSLGFSFKKFGLHNLLPGALQEKSRTLYEYKEKRKKERGEYRPYMLAVGLGFLSIGVAFSLIYLLL